MTYLWRVPDQYPEDWIARVRHPNSGTATISDTLELLPPLLQSVELAFNGRLEDLAGWDCLPNNTGLPLVGGRLVELLYQLAGADIRLVPAVILTRDGQSRSAFWLARIMHTIEAVDPEKSEFTSVESGAFTKRIVRLVHRPRCLGSHLIARDANYPSHVIVSGLLAHKIYALGATGVELRRPDSVHW
jgi:hypothetical protein